jgi:histidine decarboxylase
MNKPPRAFNPLGYFVPEEITQPRAFVLDGNEKTPEELGNAKRQLDAYVAKYRDSFLGYQSTAKLGNEHLAAYLGSAINNIGDSFGNPKLGGTQLRDGYFGLNSKWIERAVLDYFARRWHAPVPRRVPEDGEQPEPNRCEAVNDHWLRSYWGYVLSMGSTEGNLMALRGARDYLHGERLLFDRDRPPAEALHYESCRNCEDSRFNPKLLYSDASHYSVRKIAQMLGIPTEVVKTDEFGQMRLDDLRDKATRIMKVENRPIAVLFNYGTTWHGALDNVADAVDMLKPIIAQHGFDCREVQHGNTKCWRRGFWFHVDGALGAGYATFTDREPGESGRPLPVFDFRKDIMSIVMSGHKWPGAPWPTGIYMTLNKYMLTNDVPAVVGALDSTLAGSRSGIAPIFLWDWIARKSDEYRKAEAQGALARAQKAYERIKQLRNRDWRPVRSPGSIMVTFRRPSNALVRKYSLASMKEPGTDELRSHLVCMRHVDDALIKSFIDDLGREPSGDDMALAAVDDDDSARGGW